MKPYVKDLYPVGFICLTDTFCWPVYGQKPPAFHLAMLKLFFGITWKDAK